MPRLLIRSPAYGLRFRDFDRVRSAALDLSDLIRPARSAARYAETAAPIDFAN
jgi:hypothetical protein